jgi:hypothetical protein
MIERRLGLGFLDEPTFALGIGHELRGEYFEGDFAVELHVEGTIHDPHYRHG